MRLFIAAAFPHEVIAELDARVARFRSRLPRASWVRPDSQHVTFAFLGEQPESFSRSLVPLLETALQKLAPFEAVVAGCGLFPNPRHARVGWAGLEPETPFVQTATVVRAIVVREGITIDGEFKPHLTLMRIRDPWPPASIELFLASMRDFRSHTFTVGAVTLYSSRLDPKGAIHTPIASIPLGSVA